MDAADRRMYTVAGLLSGGGLLGLYYFRLWSAQLVGYLGVIVIGGTALFWLSQTVGLKQLQQQLEQQVGSEFATAKDLDDLWDDLQQWEQQDPRTTELVWRPSETHTALLPIPPTKPVYYLYSIVTPTETDEEMHIVVETQSGYIIHHTAIDDEYTVDRKHPFQHVPFVQEYRLAVMQDVMERREVKQNLKQMAQGKLPGGYNMTAVGKDMEEVLRQFRDSDQSQAAEEEFDDDEPTREGA